VEGKSKEDALKNFKNGNFDWLDSKSLDTIDSEFVYEDEWEFIE